MKPDRFPVVRINLVEAPGWSIWASGGRTIENASDAAHEDFSNLDLTRLTELVSEMVDDDLLAQWEGPKEWSPRKKHLTYEDFEWIAQEVKDGAEKLETTRFAILDTMTWAYEIAMTPDDGDIQAAMGRTFQDERAKYAIDWDLWSPIVFGVQDEGTIVARLLGAVKYEREEGHYDRYLVFDFNGLEVVKELYQESPLTRKELKESLKYEFAAIREYYLNHFWHNLQQEFRDVNVSDRVDWRKQWKAMLASPEIKNVRKEMLEAIRSRGH
jgi:hypothetical protein